MEPSRQQFTIGSLMVVIALTALGLAYPEVSLAVLFLLAWIALIFCAIGLVLLAACLLVVPVLLLVHLMARRRELAADGPPTGNA